MKNKPLTKNTLLISHIPQVVKNRVSHIKEKNYESFLNKKRKQHSWTKHNRG